MITTMQISERRWVQMDGAARQEEKSSDGGGIGGDGGR